MIDEAPDTNPRGRPPPEKLLEATYDLAHATAEASRKNANELMAVREEIVALHGSVKDAIAPKTFPRAELRILAAIAIAAVAAYLFVNLRTSHASTPNAETSVQIPR